MAGQVSRSAKSPKSGSRKRAPAVVTEFVRLLDEIRPDQSASRLKFDMARDAGLEGFRELLRQLQRFQTRLARTRQRRNVIHSRLTGILVDLASGPVRLPRPQGLPPVSQEEIVQTYQELRQKEYPAVAEALHAAIGQSDVVAFQRFLVEQALIEGNIILVEHLVRYGVHPRPPEQELHFLDDLRHHMAGVINQGLAKKTGYLVTPEVGGRIDALLGRTLRFLVDLLTSDPPVRLLTATLGSDYDASRHEPSPGRPDSGALQVRATMFPGLVLYGDPPHVLAKAQGFTKRVVAAEEPQAAAAS
jgi:hypothetical protein